MKAKWEQEIFPFLIKGGNRNFSDVCSGRGGGQIEVLDIHYIYNVAGRTH